MPKKTFSKHLLLSVLCSALLIGCAHTSPKQEAYARMQDYFKAKHHTNIPEETEAVFVLTGSGCAPCNKEFSGLMQEVDSKKAMFLITASGTRVDLSQFNTGKAFFDPDTDNPDFRKSGVFFLKNKEVDTVLYIDARDISQTIGYIRQKLEKHKD